MENNRYMLPVGTLLRGGTYRVTKQLKSGGFGNTYVVENVLFGETYAMKEFFMQGVTTRVGTTVSVSLGDNAEVFRSQKEKFKKEAQRIRKLSHPNIVKIHDLFEDNDTYYYIMDYIDGESLSDWLKSHGSMPETEALRVLKSVLDALEVVHAAGFTHMDIKPGNIMRDRQGKVYLIDFGASKQMTTAEQRTVNSTAMPYTEGYAPMEQIEKELKNVGPWTDLYAVGAMLYRLLTNRQPPTSTEIINEEDPFIFTKTISERTQSLVKWMMQPSRKKRPQSVGDVGRWWKNEAEDEATIITDRGKGQVSVESIPSEAIVRVDTRFAGLTPMTLDLEEGIHEVNVQSTKCFVEGGKFGGVDYHVDVKAGKTYYIKTDFAKYGALRRNDENYSLASRNKVETFTVKGVSFNMIRVEGGSFLMGATSEQGIDGLDEEKPVHKVVLSDYSIGETQVTQALWEAVMGIKPLTFMDALKLKQPSKNNPSRFKGANRPVECVSWNDCQEFIRRLNNLTGLRFRLPTEAEWEYAARGGQKSRGFKYAGSNKLADVAWFKENSGQTHDVGQKQPNELGLYDMSGNVWEWCSDRYGCYDSATQNNPTGPATGSYRVCRGGGWLNTAASCRVAYRVDYATSGTASDLGLRLAL